jgi:hypothetical protein
LQSVEKYLELSAFVRRILKTAQSLGVVLLRSKWDAMRPADKAIAIRAQEGFAGADFVVILLLIHQASEEGISPARGTMPTPTPPSAGSETALAALALVGGGSIHERDDCKGTLWPVVHNRRDTLRCAPQVSCCRISHKLKITNKKRGIQIGNGHKSWPELPGYVEDRAPRLDSSKQNRKQ